MNRQWGGIVDTAPDACPIISESPVNNLFFNCGWGTGGSRLLLARDMFSLHRSQVLKCIRLQNLSV